VTGFRALVAHVLIFFLASSAANATSTESLVLTAASEQQWLKLVHYESDWTSPSGLRSAIHSEEFFLDPQGKTDPHRELKATLAAFAAPEGDDPNTHAQCRFPARWLWLKSRFESQGEFPTSLNCPMYESWTGSNSIKSLSIVFATGYLGNPASYYGHTLLKFNFEGSQSQTRLMDVSVNYGAIVQKNDGPITYLAKSLAGGYDGGFSHIHFYFHNHNYGDNELRDLWEYKLDLPQKAVDLVVAHAWEVLGKRYTYHFFQRNCAYRMAEIVQVVDGLEFIPKNWPWIVPQALIQRLGAVDYQGHPLLAEASYFPSRQSRFYERYRHLSDQESALFADLVLRRKLLSHSDFQLSAISSKQAVLDALLDYYQYTANPMVRASREIRSEYTKALSARYQLEPGVPEIRSKPPVSPHLSRPVGWVQVAGGRNSAMGDMVTIRIRPAYYDALDTDSGHVPNAKLVMGDTQVNVRRDQIYLDKFDLIGVDSVKPGLTGLPGDTGIAWKVHIGVEQQRLFCDHCLVARFQSDIGYGRQFSDNIFAAAYVGGALQDKRNDQGIGFGRIAGDLIYRHSEKLRAKLGFEHRVPVDSPITNYEVGIFEARWSLNSRGDIRLKYEHDKYDFVSLGVGVYW
jgi:Domain of unknown function (DUF4105)